MTINIKDPEVDRMVRELAKAKHMKMTDVVREAIAAYQAAEDQKATSRFDSAMALLKEIDKAMEGKEKPSSNHDWLYDENGLPQ